MPASPMVEPIDEFCFVQCRTLNQGALRMASATSWLRRARRRPYGVSCLCLLSKAAALNNTCSNMGSVLGCSSSSGASRALLIHHHPL